MRLADFPMGGQGMGAGESAVTQGLLIRCVGSPRARRFDAARADSPRVRLAGRRRARGEPLLNPKAPSSP